MTTMKFATLRERWQRPLAEWQARELPCDDADVQRLRVALLVSEEAGEVSRCVLKGAQGLRGSAEEWRGELGGEIGDAIVSLMQLASLYDLDIEQLIDGAASKVLARSYTSEEASAIRRAPQRAPQQLTPREIELAEGMGLDEEAEAEEPAPNSPEDIGGYEASAAPVKYSGKRAWQAARARLAGLLEPVEADAQELFYEALRIKHAGRSLEYLAPLDLQEVCDYLELWKPTARTGNIRLRDAIRRGTLPAVYQRHIEPCSTCGSPMLWTLTSATGKRQPLDATPSAGGDITVEIEDGGAVLRSTHWGTPHAGGHKTHFATCPHAAQHRRRR
jgi:NTP pyrophosphatase (non-canonical NTP hydrolase)